MVIYAWFHATIMSSDHSLGEKYRKGFHVYFRRNNPNHPDEILLCTGKKGQNSCIISIDQIKGYLKSRRNKQGKLITIGFNESERLEKEFWNSMAIRQQNFPIK